MLGFPMGIGMAPELHPYVRGVWKKCHMTNFTMLNNSMLLMLLHSMKYALISFPGLADVGDPHGDGDGPRAPPRCQGGLEKMSND